MPSFKDCHWAEEMKSNKTEATDKEREIILQNLSRYQNLSSIIPNGPKLYRIVFDQYGGRIPSERFEEVSELSIGGILLHSIQEKDFQRLLEDLEGWLGLYPEYANEDFGKKLQNNLFNFFSELEVYDALKRAGCSPERDVSQKGIAKNLDFKARPDGRDILIEVTTPRMNLETELIYDETPHSGFFDPKRGIERDGYTGPTRVEVVVESKVKEQIQEAASGIDCPVILIINCKYAYPEIMGYGQNTSGFISGIIHYQKGTSRFNPTKSCQLSEKEKRFFARLMGPTREEQLQQMFSKENEK